METVSFHVWHIRQRISSIEGCHICDIDNPGMLGNVLEDVLRKRGRVNGRPSVLDLDERVLIKQVIGIYRKLSGLGEG